MSRKVRLRLFHDLQWVLDFVNHLVLMHRLLYLHRASSNISSRSLNFWPLCFRVLMMSRIIARAFPDRWRFCSTSPESLNHQLLYGCRKSLITKACTSLIKVTQLIARSLWHLYIEQWVDDNFKCQLMHVWININFASGKWCEKIINRFLMIA